MGDFEKLAMAQVKCIQCGASIEKGDKFCKHCGTQVPDNVMRAQIQIDNTAEIQRAAYETEESKLRQKAIGYELRTKKVIWYISLVLAIIAVGSLVLVATGLFGMSGKEGASARGTCVFIFAVCGSLSAYLAYKNLTRK